jgi:hypothetical protein
MMREREMRGFREADCVIGFVVVDDGDAGVRLVADDADANDDASWVPFRAVLLSVAVVAASAVAAAARETGLAGGGMTACLEDSINSGVVNIFLGDGLTLPPTPWGLFVIGSSTAALRGGVLARCAMMAPVVDFLTEVGPGAAVLRTFARELAVGANNLDVARLGLKMEDLLLPLLLLLAYPAGIPVPSSEGVGTASFVVLLLVMARTL